MVFNTVSVALHSDTQDLTSRAELTRSAQGAFYPSFTSFNSCDSGSQVQRFRDGRGLEIRDIQISGNIPDPAGTPDGTALSSIGLRNRQI
jgi:hypothetical protein